ncbi:MAG: PDZ domain-containing protein [Bacilli bacterium]|nr:PDZ domain-containing protein [Bacilli bacterium]
MILLVLAIFPLNTWAYSKYIIPGGNTVGIEVNSKGVLIVGLYDVEGGSNKEFKIGDRIIRINNHEVDTIDRMIEVINSESSNNNFIFEVYRDNDIKKITTNLSKDDNGVLKTGLYVKDQINGIGTLTYIDPNTRIFGALGHEIVDKNTASKFEIKDGKIYEAAVDSIKKSTDQEAGEKNAEYDINADIGNVEKNTKAGIFGQVNEISDDERIEVSATKEIHTGKATIRTVINDEKVEEFSINIIKIDPTSKTKNILFAIDDERLLKSTGGIVQGMSGSPIIQDNKIIGAVTHVIVDDVTKGYGIFITNMLEEGER